MMALLPMWMTWLKDLQVLGIPKITTHRIKHKSARFILFYKFVGNYVVGAFGYTKMMALLKENKSTSVWDHLTMDDLVNLIFIVKNHKLSWAHAFNVKHTSREEQEKYANHNTLTTPEERVTYAPKTARFIKRIKRSFGMSVVNEEGVKYYAAAKKKWKIALHDKKQVEWLLQNCLKRVNVTGFRGVLEEEDQANKY